MTESRSKSLTDTPKITGRSLDEIDNESYDAGPRPFDTVFVEVAVADGPAEFPAPAPVLSLDGVWQMAQEGDESARLAGEWADAIPAEVPGSVHTALFKAGRIPDQTVGRNQVIARKESFKTYWLKRTFDRPAGTGPFRLNFHGVAIHCTAWLNGVRLGEHEGMFGGPVFDITDKLADRNTLIVKIDPAPQIILKSSPNECNDGWKKTVVFNNVYGWHYSNLPSLGIWQPVEVASSPALRLRDPFVITRDAAAGIIDIIADIDAPAVGQLVGQISPENFDGPAVHFSPRLFGTHIHYRLAIPDPHPWWPNGMGQPNLYRMKLAFIPEAGGQADVHEFTFGLRTIEMAPLPDGPRPDKFNWTFVVNGKPMFVKGTGWCTMDPQMDFSRARYETFLRLAADEHCQMIRAWGSGMPETDDFYDLCDRLGLMVMQEWPTAWNSHEQQPFDVLEETVRLNTLRLRNRASLAIYTGGNESNRPFGPAIDMMGRLAIELDGTRAFHRGEPWGGSRHEYPTYWSRMHPDAHVISEADFYGEFGHASVPVYESVQRYLPDADKHAWPPPDNGAFLYHVPIFNENSCFDRLSMAANYFAAPRADMKQFIVGTQLTQVVALRHTLERARVRWPNCTGALLYKLNDNFPAASWATADWYGAPKIAHYFVQDAFAPLAAVVIFNSLNYYGTPINQPVVLLDETDSLAGSQWTVRARVLDGKFATISQAEFAGQGSVGTKKRLGAITVPWQKTEVAPLLVVSEVVKDGQLAFRTFYWLNCDFRRGCLFDLPQTTLSLKVAGKTATVTNTGKLPAVAAHVDRPNHLDTFRIDDNYFWLDPGESRTLAVNESVNLTAAAWNAERAG
jgi:beta-mannosidase